MSGPLLDSDLQLRPLSRKNYREPTEDDIQEVVAPAKRPRKSHNVSVDPLLRKMDAFKRSERRKIKQKIEMMRQFSRELNMHNAELTLGELKRSYLAESARLVDIAHEALKAAAEIGRMQAV